MKYLIFLFALSICFLRTSGQEISFGDTIKEYNKQRIILDTKGANVLMGWGLANVAVGGAGVFVAKQDEWKYFHGMNAAFGLVNTGLAGYGMLQARRQAMEKTGSRAAYNYFVQDRKRYIIAAGVDVVCVGAGLLLSSKSSGANTAMNKGVGHALILQGIGALAYDNIMLIAHTRYSGKWAQILDELRFTGMGLSFNYTIK